MASRRNLVSWLKWVLIFTLCILNCAALASKSVESEMKLVLGSRPPRCINRCKNCRPCMAVLVIPPHKKTRIKHKQDSSSSSTATAKTTMVMPQEEENYYLLSWKCRCRNKLFQP